MRCRSFRLGRSCAQTTTSPRAGACRLQRSGNGGRGKTNAASQKGIPKGLVPWAGAGRARRSPRGMVAWTRRPRGAQDGMLPSPGAPAKPFLKRRPFIHPTFPPRQTKIRRANSEALLPAGQTASNTHTGSAPCPTGARQRRPTRRRRQAPAIEPARRLPPRPPQTERTAACLPPARGADRRHPGANGTGRRPEGRPCHERQRETRPLP